MMALIIGGSASGKSGYAETLVCSLPGERIYLAAMEPFGAEAQERIAKHRRARAERGFRTVERYTDLKGLTDRDLTGKPTILLECAGNLLANEMFSPSGGGAGAALSGILHLKRLSGNLTVVTNEVFSAGAHYGESTVSYMRELAALNRALAAEADLVCEMVCGQPNYLKGQR